MAAEQYPLNEALKQQFLAIVNERNPQKCEHALEMLCPWYYPQGNSTSSEYQHLYPYAQIAVLEAAKVGNNTVLTSLLGTGAGWVAPNCADENGQTPLHLAVANNQLKSVQLLLSLDQAPWLTTKMEDKQGNTPLDMAQGNKQLHDLLSAYSSNLSPQHPPGGPLLHLEADDEGKQEEKHDETPLVSQSLLEKQAAFVQYILTPLVQNILSKFSIHVYQDGVVGISCPHTELPILNNYHNHLRSLFDRRNNFFRLIYDPDPILILSAMEYHQLLSKVIASLSTQPETPETKELMGLIQQYKNDHYKDMLTASKPAPIPLDPPTSFDSLARQSSVNPSLAGLFEILDLFFSSIFDKTRPKSAIFREADPLDPNAMKFGFLSYRMAGSYARTLQKILGDQINIIQNGDTFTFNLSESQITRLLALGKQALLPEASTLQQIQLLINELKIKQLLAFMDTDPNSTFKSLPSHDASSLKILLCPPEKIEEMLTLIEAIKGLVPDSSLIKIEDNGFDLSREQLLALKERLPLSETEKSKIDILIGGLSPEDAAAKESSHYLRSPYGGMMMPRREDERKAPDPRGEENEKQKAVGKQAPK